MNENLRDLYAIPEHITPFDPPLIALMEKCNRSENCVRTIMSTLSPGQREILEEYILLRDELDVCAINQAIKPGKRCK